MTCNANLLSVITVVVTVLDRNLCDSQAVGKLNAEQFALAMHLVQQKLAGVEPPEQLKPDMIPPSMRQTVRPV